MSDLHHMAAPRRAPRQEEAALGCVVAGLLSTSVNCRVDPSGPQSSKRGQPIDGVRHQPHRNSAEPAAGASPGRGPDHALLVGAEAPCFVVAGLAEPGVAQFDPGGKAGGINGHIPAKGCVTIQPARRSRVSSSAAVSAHPSWSPRRGVGRPQLEAVPAGALQQGEGPPLSASPAAGGLPPCEKSSREVLRAPLRRPTAFRCCLRRPPLDSAPRLVPRATVGRPDLHWPCTERSEREEADLGRRRAVTLQPSRDFHLVAVRRRCNQWRIR